MKMTPTEHAAYNLQIQEMKSRPDSTCANCHHGEPMSLGLYSCKRKPAGDAIKVMINHEQCMKWRGW